MRNHDPSHAYCSANSGLSIVAANSASEKRQKLCAFDFGEPQGQPRAVARQNYDLPEISPISTEPSWQSPDIKFDNVSALLGSVSATACAPRSCTPTNLLPERC